MSTVLHYKHIEIVYAMYEGFIYISMYIYIYIYILYALCPYISYLALSFRLW